MVAVTLACVSARIARAAECAVRPFALRIEERELPGGGRGLVALGTAGAPGIERGDVLRQANGARLRTCADLERAAAEASAGGLVLLLGVERDGRLLALVAPRPEEERIVAAPPVAPVPAPVPPQAPAGGGAAGAGAGETTPARAGAATPASLPPPRREVALPPRGDAGRELAARAAAAAAALAKVDEAAAPDLPLNLYERRLGDAEAAVATLAFGVDDTEARVRDCVEEILALHRTARAVRRAQLRALADGRIDRRAPGASTLPYFSGSDVPLWVATYPFLQPTIVEQPRATRFPVPGESAGRWDSARALELLWERARAARGALASWAASG